MALVGTAAVAQAPSPCSVAMTVNGLWLYRGCGGGGSGGALAPLGRVPPVHPPRESILPRDRMNMPSPVRETPSALAMPAY